MSIDKKCAPGKVYKDGSCLSDESLKKIILNYNKKNKDKININLPRKELVTILERKLSNVCNEQTCWLKLDVVQELEDKFKEDVEENTFRPKGPAKKYEWLSTTHINEVIEQYQNVHKNFIFLGAVPYDFEDLAVLGIHDLNFDTLIKDGKTKIGLVINLDNHDQGGSHWVSLFADLEKSQVYFFDSVGQPPRKRIRKFINRIVKFLYHKKYNTKLQINDTINTIKSMQKLSEKEKYKQLTSSKYLKNLLDGSFDIKYNTKQHQFRNSECGVYSINFIVRLVNGEPYTSIVENITKDEEMNKFRKEYFRNVN